MNTINERIKTLVMHFTEGNNSMFANKLGVSEANIRNYIAKTEPKYSILEKIVNTFEINYEWLLTGNGEMLKSEAHSGQLIVSSSEGVPYYENVEIAGGVMPMYSDYRETPTFYINYEHFNDCTAYLPVVGDSMYPNYCSGEIVAVKEIVNKDVIQWGETYFIATNGNANDLKTIKQVHHHDDESKIILRASNPNYKGDIIINKEDILHMFIVKGKIKRNQL
ncbi:S24 family peptidase [Empedobacter brevis]|uniref:S24 family peptidase n=1 Tax=Empedobacter brevis TaxID=247 RepID=UPI00289F071B|nr:S24 family peptidase [Empedobacter brevis]